MLIIAIQKVLTSAHCNLVKLQFLFKHQSSRIKCVTCCFLAKPSLLFCGLRKNNSNPNREFCSHLKFRAYQSLLLLAYWEWTIPLFNNKDLTKLHPCFQTALKQDSDSFLHCSVTLISVMKKYEFLLGEIGGALQSLYNIEHQRILLFTFN